MGLGFGLLTAQTQPGETDWTRAYDETCDDLASFGPRHRRMELAPRDDVELPEKWNQVSD